MVIEGDAFRGYERMDSARVAEYLLVEVIRQNENDVGPCHRLRRQGRE